MLPTPESMLARPSIAIVRPVISREDQIILTDKARQFLDASPDVPRTYARGLPRTGSNRKRRELRDELMAVHPFCSNCGIPLTETPDMGDSVHIVRKRLSCPACVKVVRHDAKVDKAARKAGGR